MEESGIIERRILTTCVSGAALAIILYLLIWSGTAWAADPMAAAPIDGFVSNAITYGATIGNAAYRAARWLFWTLATIQIAWSASQLLLRG